MLKGKNLGEFEILVLTALVRLGPDAYGVSVRDEIEKRTGRSVSVGALYATLGRLEEKGLVSSRLGAATPERGGRAKKHYQVEAEGRRRLESSLAAFGRMAEGVLPWPGSQVERGAT
jgi:DNA-binding PadR family transcriptional regulator